MLIPVVLMIVVYIVYHLLTWVAGRKQNSDVLQQQKVAQKEQQILPAKAPVVAVAPTVDLNSQISRVENSVRDQLNTINQQINDNRDQVAKTNDFAQQNQNDIALIKQEITAINLAVVKIAEDLQKLTKPKKIKKIVKAKFPIPVYHVVAIVPGRAWLQSGNGQTLTVRAGDKLAGYGTVDLISPRQGLVITSSGSIIQYGANDI
jgi:intracellular multiplication protein IcmG